MREYNRRAFIKTMGLMTGSVLLIPACMHSTSTTNQPYLVFTADEVVCLEALCGQLIPADQDPGAVETGVLHFIDRQIHLRFPNEKELFSGGIRSLQQWCTEQHRKRFEELSSPLQIEIMQAMERNEIDSEQWEPSPKQFFDRLLNRTMQGFYGSPRHGGNKDYASYRMLKLDYPLLIGQNRY